MSSGFEFITGILYPLGGPVFAGAILIITRPWWENIIRKHLIKKEISSALHNLESFPSTMNQKHALHEIDQIKCYVENNQNTLGLSLKNVLISRLQIIEDRVKSKTPHNNLDNAIRDTLNLL